MPNIFIDSVQFTQLRKP